MSYKVNSLNPFDKGFFGKSIAAWSKIQKSKGEMLAPSVLKSDSIDDFNRHFDMLLFKPKFEKSPVADLFESTPAVVQRKDFFAGL